MQREGKSRHSDSKKEELIKGCLGNFVFFLGTFFCKSTFLIKNPKANAKCNGFIKKSYQKDKGNPLALTLGTTILLNLCNF